MAATHVGILVGLVTIAASGVWLATVGMPLAAAVAAAALLGIGAGTAALGICSAASLAERLRWLLWPQAAAVVVITWMAYLHILPAIGLLQLPHADKVMHFTLFGMVAFFGELWLRGQRWRGAPVSLLLLLSLAATEELAQTRSPYRTADLGDLACDVMGMGVACLLAARVRGWETLRPA